MHVLHITCGFTYTNVYQNLFEQMKNKGLSFDVYVPQHKGVKDIDYHDFDFNIYANKIIKSYDKFLYYTKIIRMVKDVESVYDINKINFIHAHSLFSDGAVAYEIFKKYNIPYIVAIRNTDVNKYFKYAPHLQKYALDILRNSKKIIYISHAYKKNVEKKYIPKKYRENINSKTLVIPNGIDKYWNEHCFEKKEININQPKIIFVGAINKNKNLETLIKVVNEFQSKGVDMNLKVVGDGKLLKNIKYKYRNKNYIEYYGHIKDKKNMERIYRNSDILVVPSITETFGLVYPEAMSCGLPVIYTINQGFDGYFKQGEVGYGVNPTDVYDIYSKIQSIIENYSEISKRCYKSIGIFDWNKIADTYIDVYYE